MDTNLTFTGAEAARLTAALETQIHHLVRCGVVTPVQPAIRRGISAKFSPKNLVEITVGAELLNAGISTVMVNNAVRLVSKRGNWLRLCDPDSRDSVAVLVLLKMLGNKNAPVTMHLFPVADIGDLCNTGYTILAAVPVGYIMRTIEKSFSAEDLW